MRAFARASVVGGSFVVGIGVGDSGRSGRENKDRSVFFLRPPLLLLTSRVACPRWPMKSLLGYGRSTGRFTNWSKIESVYNKSGFARDLKLVDSSLYLLAHQKFQVSDEEIEMDLAQFRQLYANQMGTIEYVQFLFVPTVRY
jgi:hypothetical protein